MRTLHVFTILGTPKAFFDGQFRFLADHGFDQHLITADPEDPQFSERNRLTYHQSEVARKIDIAADIRAIRDIRRYIRREGIQAVFGHTPKGAMVAMIAARLAGVRKRIYYRHGLIYTTAHGPKRFILKSVERLTSFLATDIINVSPSLSALAVTDRLNGPRKQRVIGSGTCGGIDASELFNPDKLSPEEIVALKKKYGISEEDFVFGFCGRLCRDKGIPELIDAFALFRARHPEIPCKLLLVGRFDERDALTDEQKAAIIDNEAIISTGGLPHEALPAHYALMGCFVFPSHREGFGMTVIEASAMQRPVLVSKAHGCVDTIIPDKTGLYIGLSPEEICEGMERMLDPDLRRRLGAGGRAHVLHHFDQNILRPQIALIHKEILNIENSSIK